VLLFSKIDTTATANNTSPSLSPVVFEILQYVFSTQILKSNIVLTVSSPTSTLARPPWLLDDDEEDDDDDDDYN